MRGLLSRSMLSERQTALLEELRALLQGVHTALDQFGADVLPGDLRTIKDMIEHLDELFLLVVAGEFNSGKSSFLNALLGDQVLAEGVTPTTDRITLLRYGPEPGERMREAAFLERTFPLDLLRQINVVDTPGTNAIIRRHEELTRDFIPRADLVLFVTSADRPFTESERAFLEAIREWGKKVVVILNKIDILETEAERNESITHVREGIRSLFGFTPEIFPVSARLAKRARTTPGAPGDWAASRFEAVERFVVETLDEEERVRLKLLSPALVARRLTEKYLQVVEGRLDTLQEDFATIDNIDRQLEIYRADLQADFEYHLNDISAILTEFELRGNQFFDEYVQVGRIMQLLRTEEMQQIFSEQVVADTPRQIEARVNTLIDWMIDKNLRVWHQVMDYLTRERLHQHRGRLIGEVGGSFDYNRQQLLESVGRRASEVVERYDRQAEAETISADVRSALAATALVEVGAVGLGALLVAVLHTTFLDFTGLLAAGALAVVGMFVLPARRRASKEELHQRISEMRESLVTTLRRQFERELESSLLRIREAIGPYTRFVRAQREQLTGAQQRLSDLDVDLEKFATQVQGR